jgi:hypothetical protein
MRKQRTWRGCVYSLSIQEAAAALGLSHATAFRDWGIRPRLNGGQLGGENPFRNS